MRCSDSRPPLSPRFVVLRLAIPPRAPVFVSPRGPTPATGPGSVAPSSASISASTPPPTLAWQPPWLLREPLRLAVVRELPVYHGPLRLLSGPQRIETGWWVDERSDASLAQRDYHVALSPQAGLVWIFLLRGKQPAWYLHGIYG